MKKIGKLLCFFLIALSFASVLSVGFFAAGQAETIELKYDDFYALSGYETVSVADAGKPESYKVGYGVAKGEKDDAVFEVVNGKIHATGIGTGKIILDGVEYTVKVDAAPISMFLLIGQSNMYGTEGDSTQSVANENGQVYSTFCHPAYLTPENAGQYVASALSGRYSLLNRYGTTDKLIKSPVNRLTADGDGKFGLDSGFAYQYNKITGDKVWTVNVARGSTEIINWQKGAAEYEKAVAVFKQAQKVMRAEIKAGHYVLNDYGYLWCHGCSDRVNTAEYYLEKFLAMHNNLKKDLAYDIDGDGKSETLEFCNIIMPRKGRDDCVSYRHGTNTDKTDASFCTSFNDLEMSGPRVAQYWLVNNPDYPDINLVCNIGDKWVTMPDGSDGVSAYFKKHYKNGKVDYPVQVPQEKEWYTPTTPADVHDSIHYNQIGFNEIGIEAARNTAYLRKRAEKPSGVKTKVTFYDWTGYKQAASINASNWADSRTLVVPVVYPVYESKNVTYKLSDNLSYHLYDLTSDYKSEGGTLESVGAYSDKTVTVKGKTDVKKGGAAYYFESTASSLVAVSDSKYQSNSLTTVEGKVTSGKHKKVVYQLEKTVNLKKSNSWLVQWTGKSTSSSTSQESFVLLCEYIRTKNTSAKDINYIWHRYTKSKSASLTVGTSIKRGTGHILSAASAKINPNEYHTYTLWNEPSSDGKNKVCFAVDGKLTGEITKASGIDFAFKYIGADGYEINNYIFKNLKIIESLNCSEYGHSIINKTVKATCTAKGSLTEKCLGCSYKASSYSKALGHNYSGKYVSDGNATYLKDGTKSVKCTRCTAKKTVADKGSKLVLGRTSKITVNGKGTSATLTWTKCKGATGYRVYIKQNGSWKQIKLVSGTEYTVKGLKPMTDYSFAVKAYTKEGGKVINAPKYTSVTASSGLEAPAVRVASTAKGRATVAWDDIEGESGYQVWYSTSKNGKFIKIGNYNADTVKVYKNMLPGGRTCYFKVRAYAKTPAGTVYSDYSSVKAVKIK